MNTFTLIGRLARDVTYNDQTPTPRAYLTLAVDRPGSETANFISMTAFGKTASILHDYTDKGRQIAVTGHLETNERPIPDSTDKITVPELIVDHVELLGRKLVSNTVGPKRNDDPTDNKSWPGGPDTADEEPF